MVTVKTFPKDKHRILIVDDHPIFRQGSPNLSIRKMTFAFAERPMITRAL